MLGREEIFTCGQIKNSAKAALLPYTQVSGKVKDAGTVSLAGRSGETPVAGKARSWRTLQATLRSLDFFYSF